jgi:predicted Zn-dependent protease
MLIKKIIFILFILFSCFGFYAEQLPDIGDSDRVNLSYLDAEKIGFQIMLDIKSSNQILLDYDLNDYIQNLGSSLSGFNFNKLNFYVVKGKEINAFALPGGFICVYNGLIGNTQSEAELVSVIAHEIGHIVQHHIFRNIAIYNRSQYIAVAGVIAAALLSLVNPALAIISANGSQGIAIQNILSFSRDFEREADRVGQSIMYNSGYDPNAMPLFFTKLEEQDKFNPQLKNNFLQTHPITIERISEAQLRANQYKTKMRPDSVLYQLMKERSRVWLIGSKDAIKYYNNVLISKRYSDINNIFYGLSFAYYLQNNPRSGLFYLNKINHRFFIATVYSLKAMLLQQSHDYIQAQIEYQKALALYPQYKSLWLGNIDNYIFQHRFNLAQILLMNMAKKYSYDNDIWIRLVNINSDRLLNNQIMYYYALGNINYNNYNFAEALRQYGIALNKLVQQKNVNSLADIISAKMEQTKTQINFNSKN